MEREICARKMFHLPRSFILQHFLKLARIIVSRFLASKRVQSNAYCTSIVKDE